MFMLSNPEDYTILSLDILDIDIDVEHWGYFGDTEDDDGINGGNTNGDTAGDTIGDTGGDTIGAGGDTGGGEDRGNVGNVGDAGVTDG